MFYIKYFFRGNFRCFHSARTVVRVRFAPSPTGYLHLGGLRTALYNFLFAHSKGGKFILRIEDTDRTRAISGAVQQIQLDLEWLGLTPDEGPLHDGPFAPYIQSERGPLYRDEVNRLIQSGAAYYCFCSERRLDLLRKEAIRNRQVPKYDNHCRNLSKSEIETKLSSGVEKCVRFKLVSAEPFIDLVYGKILHEVHEIEGDPVILKNDGWPTYHLANVVDDSKMKITHVIRGVEWIQSTNKHLMIYRALGYSPPSFAHLPLLLNADGSKLSKRQGDLSVDSIRKKGIMPRALINFVLQAGSGFPDRINKNSSLEELAAKFDITNVSTNSTKLPFEKIYDFNKLELARKVNDESEINNLVKEVTTMVLQSLLSNRLEKSDIHLDDAHVKTILNWSLPRIKTLQDLVGPNMAFLWIKPRFHASDINQNVLANLKNELQNLEFEEVKLKKFFKAFSQYHQIPFKDLMKIIRSSISGLEQGPGVAEMLMLLGKDASLKRIEMAQANHSKAQSC